MIAAICCRAGQLVVVGELVVVGVFVKFPALQVQELSRETSFSEARPASDEQARARL